MRFINYIFIESTVYIGTFRSPAHKKHDIPTETYALRTNVRVVIRIMFARQNFREDVKLSYFDIYPRRGAGVFFRTAACAPQTTKMHVKEFHNNYHLISTE